MICDRRMIVGGEIHAADASDHAAHLFKRATLAEGIDGPPNKPVLHGENGSTLKARQCAGRHWRGVKPSFHDRAFLTTTPFQSIVQDRQIPTGILTVVFLHAIRLA